MLSFNLQFSIFNFVGHDALFPLWHELSPHSIFYMSDLRQGVPQALAGAEGPVNAARKRAGRY